MTIYFRDPDTETDTLVSTATYTYGTRVQIVAPVAPNETTFLTWLGDVDIISPSALVSTATVTLTKDATLTATYYYPEAPEYYNLSVYDGYPQSGSYPAGSQQTIRANIPSQGWEFYKWYGDIQYLVNPDTTLSENAVIMPSQSITLYAKFKVEGELALFRVSVTDGTASGTYYTEEGQVEHNESGSYIDVPAGTEVTLTADPDTVGFVFDYWNGNFVAAGVDDIDTTVNPTVFTMVENNINVTMVRRELGKYYIHPTNANAPSWVYPNHAYSISGNLVNTEDRHYTFDRWLCVDANEEDCITAIASPTSESTTITATDRDLWITAVYTTYYRLTVSQGQGSGYYTEGQVLTTVRANTAPTGMQFDHWEDPMGVIADGYIYAVQPRIVMKNSPATITAVYTSLDAAGNSVAVTGSDLHTGIIRRIRTSLINGVFAVGTIVFDRDGCIGVITEVDPDHSDDTDDYRVQKLFYGGNF